MKKRFLPIILGSALMVFSISSCSPSGEGGEIVENEKVTGVSLNKTNLVLTMGNSETLIATVKPTNAANKYVRWFSDNADIASVSQDGEVLGVSAGTTSITVTTEDGGFTASCNVTVNAGTVRARGISLNYDKADVTINKKLSLRVIFDPQNTSNQNVTWTSSKTNVATVVDGVVTGVGLGTSTITATSQDGNFKATCEVTVKEPEEGEDYTPNPSDLNILKITAAGEYTLERDYKQVYVEAPGAEVVLNMNGYTIENNENSPIYVKDCDSFDIAATKSKTSYIKDTRSMYTTDDKTQGKGAIYVLNGDLKLKGTGTINLNAGYYNGIYGKDDVKIQKLTLNLEAVNHGIRGNDSVTITSGTINIKCGGDGLHTENSDISSKGNQRGNVTVNGGNLTINSWGDAIQASYNAVFEETDETAPITFSAKTNKNSSYDGERIDTSSASFYLKMSSSLYSNGDYTYAAYMNNTWYKATYKGTQSQSTGGMGRQTTYYFYEIEKPQNVTSFTLYRFNGSNVTTFSTTSYNAKSDAKAFNDDFDTVQVNSVNNKKINFGSWTNYASKNAISSKGIKAENEVNIKGGTLDINAYDDGIHAKNDGSLENGEIPLGNVNISGGTTTLNVSDDGVHADNILNIKGGKVDVQTSYEGAEGNLINISDGELFINATDDGVNAFKGPASPHITISGGYVDVTVSSSGDTDGLDSNDAYTQNGGVVILKGPGNAGGTSRGSAALDTDGKVTINDGTLIVFGGIEQTPTYKITRTLCSSTTVMAGNHSVSFASATYETTLKYNTNGCIVFSNLGNATLR